jgi:ribosome-binding protein aMBF1 (putative translation factor)
MEGRTRRGAHEPQAAFGAAVKLLREQAAIDQPTLAQRSEIDATQIGRIEAGEAEPHWGTARRLAKALGISLPALVRVVEEFEARMDSES